MLEGRHRPTVVERVLRRCGRRARGARRRRRRDFHSASARNGFAMCSSVWDERGRRTTHRRFRPRRSRLGSIVVRARRLRVVGERRAVRRVAVPDRMPAKSQLSSPRGGGRAVRARFARRSRSGLRSRVLALPRQAAGRRPTIGGGGRDGCRLRGSPSTQANGRVLDPNEAEIRHYAVILTPGSGREVSTSSGQRASASAYAAATSSAVRSHVYPAARASPAAESRAASASSVRTRVSGQRQSPSAPAGGLEPRVVATSSSVEVPREVTTGVPWAMASTTGKPKPSSRLGKHITVAAA